MRAHQRRRLLVTAARVTALRERLASETPELGAFSGVSASSTLRDASCAEPTGLVYIETYGCQMNASDSEIVASVLQTGGWAQTEELDAAQLVLLNTCAIRDKAEQTVWKRLRHMQRNWKERNDPPVVGVLGCMAERLKTKLLEDDRLVQLVAGPDAYRDLPRLIDLVRTRRRHGSDGAALDADEELLEPVNVQLSVDETYADIAPVRAQNGSKVSAFATIMRGCNNMCSFCIVPFTRGRERARSSTSIVDEVKRLSDEGFKEVVLLGQNVNSYWDRAEAALEGRKPTMLPAGECSFMYRYILRESCSQFDSLPLTSLLPAEGPGSAQTSVGSSAAGKGFTNLYRLRGGEGVRFAELLDAVADVDPEMRVRFTSPHPKDFPPELLAVVAARSNVCSQLHLPVQSGATTMLERMRRGYSREAFFALAELARTAIPGVTLSTDVIAGFCGESAEEHGATVSLMEAVRFEQAYMYAYSMREHTKAHRKFEDDVPQALKAARLNEIIAAYRAGAALQNAREVLPSAAAAHAAARDGNSAGGADGLAAAYHVVLVEGPSKRSSEEHPQLTGRTDTNKRVVLDARPVPTWRARDSAPLAASAAPIAAGEYVMARVVSSGVATLHCEAAAKTTLADFDALLRRGVVYSAALRVAEGAPRLFA